jgi:hypothetical protein
MADEIATAWSTASLMDGLFEGRSRGSYLKFLNPCEAGTPGGGATIVLGDVSSFPFLCLRLWGFIDLVDVGPSSIDQFDLTIPAGVHLGRSRSDWLRCIFFPISTNARANQPVETFCSYKLPWDMESIRKCGKALYSTKIDESSKAKYRGYLVTNCLPPLLFPYSSFLSLLLVY